MLFIIYINDLPDKVKSLCKLFADDTKLYTAIITGRDQRILQQDLINLCDWSDDALMLQCNKCKDIQYGYIQFEFDYKMRDIYKETDVHE